MNANPDFGTLSDDVREPRNLLAIAVKRRRTASVPRRHGPYASDWTNRRNREGETATPDPFVRRSYLGACQPS